LPLLKFQPSYIRLMHGSWVIKVYSLKHFAVFWS